MRTTPKRNRKERIKILNFQDQNTVLTLQSSDDLMANYTNQNTE